ncbi:MAG: hypothetical protein RL095_1273 [Verrucomicrobiota bacterium]|jgi:hypothetical protein
MLAHHISTAKDDLMKRLKFLIPLLLLLLPLSLWAFLPKQRCPEGEVWKNSDLVCRGRVTRLWTERRVVGREVQVIREDAYAELELSRVWKGEIKKIRLLISSSPGWNPNGSRFPVLCNTQRGYDLKIGRCYLVFARKIPGSAADLVEPVNFFNDLWEVSDKENLLTDIHDPETIVTEEALLQKHGTPQGTVAKEVKQNSLLADISQEPLLGVPFGSSVIISGEFIDKPKDYYSQNMIRETCFFRVQTVNGFQLNEPVDIAYHLREKPGVIEPKPGLSGSFEAYESLVEVGDPWLAKGEQGWAFHFRHVVKLRAAPKAVQR